MNKLTATLLHVLIQCRHLKKVGTGIHSYNMQPEVSAIWFEYFVFTVIHIFSILATEYQKDCFHP